MSYTAIDLFAGAGGSSLGLEAAGLTVTWAANHAPLAVALHARNMPLAKHVCQDLHQARWEEVPVPDLLWASPACQGHTKAATHGLKGRRRGTAPKADVNRATAWAVVSAIETLGPRWVVVENVIEFSEWVLYPTWLMAIGALGYEVEIHHFDAADFGCPADRLRTFVIATPLGSGGSGLPKPPSRRSTALDAVRLDEGRWRRPRDCAEGVQERARRQRDRWGHEGAWFTQSVTDHPGRSLTATASTVTTQHQHGLFKIEGRELLYRPWTLPEYARALGWPEDYDWGRTGVCRGAEFLGNAVAPPVAKWIAEHLVSERS